MDDTANVFIIGNGTTVNIMRNEALESQVLGYQKNWRRLYTVQVACKS